MASSPVTLWAWSDGERIGKPWIEWQPLQSTNEQNFDRMLRSIGFHENSTILTRQDFEIIEALDKALQLAPKRRSRP